jgi:hypothetical protein
MAKNQNESRPMSPQAAYLRSGRFLHEDRYALVFLLIIATILSTALVANGTLGLILTLALQTTTLLVTLQTAEAGRRLRRFGQITSAIVFLGAATVIFTGDPHLARIAYGISMLMLVAVTPAVIVRRLAKHPVISINTVTGAADIYLLFGLFFAVVYGFVGDILAGGTMPAYKAFFIASRPLSGNDFIYYSFVTLTTVGYGDIISASEIGRMLSITEALLGQLYLVTVVALLVANIGRSRRPRLIDDSGVEAPDTAEEPS